MCERRNTVKPDGRYLRHRPHDWKLAMHVYKLKLRRTWFDALVKIRDFGPAAWCDHIRARGARQMMLRRMVSCGYVTPPPYTVTAHGHKYIALCKERYHWPDYRDEMIAVPIFKGASS